jgi:hypothetical protein
MEKSKKNSTVMKWIIVGDAIAMIAAVALILYRQYPKESQGWLASFTSWRALAIGTLVAIMIMVFQYRRQVAQGVQKGLADLKNGSYDLGSMLRSLRHRNQMTLPKFSRGAGQVASELRQAIVDRDRAVGTARGILAERVQDLQRELDSLQQPAARVRVIEKRSLVAVGAALSLARKGRDAQKPGTLLYLRGNVAVQGLKIELEKLQGKGDGKRNKTLVQAELDLARAQRVLHPLGSPKYKELDGRVQRRKAELAVIEQKKK